MKQIERKQIEANARKSAFVFVISGAYAKQKRFSWFRLQSGDKRTFYGKAYNKAVAEFAAKFEKESEAAMVKFYKRAELKKNHTQWFCDVTTNPLWLDYQRTKCYNSTRIFSDHLADGCRNHWAKEPQDYRVLAAILKARANQMAN